jgi:glycosyltransferase involved in cell wall biosynthesis
MRKMIFHIPFRIDDDLHSGSQIRPRKMMNAFERVGYAVEIVQGYVNERRKKIREIKKGIKKGQIYDFVYSESSTMPTALTEKHHFPIAPFLDFAFFRFLRKNRIRIGLFYRDIHWLFEQYSSRTNLLKRTLAKLFYRYDLIMYRRLIDCVYLPCLAMHKYIPYLSRKLVCELPPGGKRQNRTYESSILTKSYSKPLQLIYVGGMGKLYNLTVLVEIISQLEGFFLTLSTREKDWERNKHEYEQNVHNQSVVFHSGQKLKQDYSKSDIAVLFVKPLPYWEFVMPLKLFEYMSFLLPVVGVQGTAAGTFISDNNIGWSIPYNADSLRELLLRIRQSPDEITEKVHNIRHIIGDHTWEARARKVVEELSH